VELCQGSGPRDVAYPRQDNAERKASYDGTSAGDIVSKHVSESAQNFISKLRGRGCKRATETAGGKKGRKSRNNKIKRALGKIIKRGNFS